MSLTASSSDELTKTVVEAIQTLPPARKADFLLNFALDLIDQGQYGDKVDSLLDVYLRTPSLPRSDIAKAHAIRDSARKAAGERLLLQSQQATRTCSAPTAVSEPAFHRAPPEVWERIARHIPRYHLRNWLFVSAFHRDIAVRLIFQTLDLWFHEDQESSMKSFDVLDRVKTDPVFANRVKTLRFHWAREEGFPLDLMMRIICAVLPDFKALRDFEWIGYPEMQAEFVTALLSSHPNLRSLGLIGWHFDAVGVSAFRNLRKFTLRAEDDDGFAEMEEVQAVLDQNSHSLRHLCLGASLARIHSWDRAFQSVTIEHLTHLDLVDTRISPIVLARIPHARNLQSLTLHGTLEEPESASAVFGSDHMFDGEHTCLPHLAAFRFVLVGHDTERRLYQSVIQFLKRRPKLRRLDLGACPWDLVLSLLPDLEGLRVLRTLFSILNPIALGHLVKCIPESMSAMHIATSSCEHSLDIFAPFFCRFHSLSFLHLLNVSKRRPRPVLMYYKNKEGWKFNARNIAASVPSLDFLGWHGEYYVIMRRMEEGKPPLVEIKELPSRRRLDCGKGMDLGSDDANWLERRDVPIDYEMANELAF